MQLEIPGFVPVKRRMVGGVFVVDGLVFEAAVEDAYEAVAEGS